MKKIPPTNFDPFDDRYRELELAHKAEIARFDFETDWLEFIPEAKEYIAKRSVEIGKDIASLKQAWEKNNKLIASESAGAELETRQILNDAIYSAEISRLAGQLRTLAKEANRHLSKLISNEIGEQPHYTSEEIETARAYPLVDLFEENGSTLKRSGHNFMTLCPFHDECTPSCCIYPSDNSYHCFGCQAHGNAIDYVMKSHNLDFLEAMKSLLGK